MVLANQGVARRVDALPGDGKSRGMIGDRAAYQRGCEGMPICVKIMTPLLRRPRAGLR